MFSPFNQSQHSSAEGISPIMTFENVIFLPLDDLENFLPFG